MREAPMPGSVMVMSIPETLPAVKLLPEQVLVFFESHLRETSSLSVIVISSLLHEWPSSMLRSRTIIGASVLRTVILSSTLPLGPVQEREYLIDYRESAR